MKSRLSLGILICSAWMLPSLSPAEQQVLRMEASVSPSEIFLGETAQLSIFVHGYHPDLGAPDLSAIPANITLISQQDRSQHSIQVRNGRQQITRRSGRTFLYRVEPQDTGTLSFAPITLQDPKGDPIPIDTPTLDVKPIPVQPYVQLWVTAPTNTVILDEEFDVSLFVRIRKPPPPLEMHTPIPDAPHLRIPYLDLHPGEGLKSENITQLLQRFFVRDGEAFRINDRVLGRDPFGGMFAREDAARFRLPRITDPEDNHFYLYELRTRWSADRAGDYTFGPVRFRGNVITQIAPDGNAQQSDIYAWGDAVTVQVQPPPSRGRPPTFIGASGSHFTIETFLDTQVCQVGDPVTLTVEISGDGAPNRIRSPRPETLAPLEQDFRIQPSPIRSESIANGRRFAYIIRPRHAGTLEIPVLEIAYFDLASRTYKTTRSDPLPIRVNPSEELEHEMITTVPTRGRIAYMFSAPPGDLPPAPFDWQRPRTSTLFRATWHIPLLLLGPVVFLLSVLIQRLPTHIPIIQAHLQRKQAYQDALAQLQQSNHNAVNILRRYLTLTLGQAFAKGDVQSMHNILQRLDMKQQDRDRIVEILTQTAYSGRNETDSNQIRKIIDTIAAKHQQGKKPVLFHLIRRTHCVLFILLSALGVAVSVHADQVSRFEERRSTLLLMQSQTTEDFARAANALADRMDQGDRDPVLLYNLGTALLLAEQPGLALPILQWAERRGATSWNVRRNMLVAQRMVTQNPTLQLPWIRTLLFWHYRITVSSRLTAAAFLFSLIWILATIRRFSSIAKWLMLPTAVALMLFSISIAASVYAEHQNEQDWAMQRRQIQGIYELHHEEEST